MAPWVCGGGDPHRGTRPPLDAISHRAGAFRSRAQGVYGGHGDGRAAALRWWNQRSSAEAGAYAALPACQTAGHQDHRPDQLRLPVGVDLRRGRDRLPAGRRLGGQYRVRLRHDDPGHARRADPADSRRGARSQPGVGRGRPAVRVVRERARRGAPLGDPFHEGDRRPRRQARGWSSAAPNRSSGS